MKNKKKSNSIIQCIVSFLLCLCISMGGIIPVYGEPENTTERLEEVVEIHISSYEDLVELAEQCTLDGWSRNKVVYLDADISCEGEFLMIPSFGGSFYGQGHCIHNLLVTSSGSYAGLFRYIQETGKVVNLKVSGQVEPIGSKSYVGGIAGSNSGTIENCSFQGSVRGQDDIGGIAGINQVTGIIRNCTGTGVVYGNHGAGGIAGENQGVIQSCRNESHVNAVVSEETVDLSSITIEDITTTEHATDITDAGGIAGISSGVIQNSTNGGLVGYQHIGYNIGGIVGRQSGYVGTCTNQGSVYGRKEVGGIVGQMEPNMILEYNQTTLEQINPQLKELQASIDQTLTDMNGTTSAIGKELETMSPYVKSASESAEAMLDAYKEEKEPEISDKIDEIESEQPDTTEEDTDNIQVELDHMKVSEDNAAFQAAKTNFSDAMRNIADCLARLGTLMADDGVTLNQDVQNISNQAFGILDTLTYGVKEENQDLIEDVSDEDNPEAVEGKVADCINQGKIEGDLNVGGIAGAMSIEHDLDPEDDIQIEGEASVNVQYKTRVVIRSCENQGDIFGKKDCIGGIAGNMTMGSIMNSVTTGVINSNSGDYIGGIAGWSEGIIRNCSAKCWLSGENYIGGIVGQGNEIYDSHAMIRIEEGTEWLGAIAGRLEETGAAEGNFFVGNDIAGIDGISYVGKAEPITQEELTAKENVSDIFSSCTVQFIAEEQVISRITVDYGTGLSAKDIPEVPEQESCYGVWEDWDSSHVTFDEHIEAVYTNYVTALESEEKRNETMSVLVVDGAFTEKDELQLEEYQGNQEAPVKNKAVVEAWSLTIPEDASETYLVRYLPPENEKGIVIYILDGNTWTRLESEEDGKYLTFTTEENEITFMVLAKKKPFWYKWFHE